MLPELLQGLGQDQAGAAPPKQPFSGTHYAKEPIKGNVLHGDKRGMTGEGEESDRVYLPPRGAPAAVHVYDENGQVYGKHLNIISRPHAYNVAGMYSIADIDKEPTWAQAKQAFLDNAQTDQDPAHAELQSRNEAEWALHDAGWDGYRSGRAPGNVVLFGDHPAKPLAKHRQEQAQIQHEMEQGGEGTDASISEGGSPDQEAGTNVDSAPAPTPSGPFAMGHKVPLNPPDMHENHAEGSDPASLG